MDAIIVLAIILFAIGLALVVYTFRSNLLQNFYRQYQAMIGLTCIVASACLIKPRVDKWPVEVQQFIAISLVIAAFVFAKLVVTKVREANSAEK